MKFTVVLLAIFVVQLFAKSDSDFVISQSFYDRSDLADAVEIKGGVMFGTFNKEDGPFLIKNSVVVPDGQELIFGPGTKIYVGGKYSTITVFGKLVVNGTPAKPVIFQSGKKDPRSWDWDRIYIRSRGRSVLKNCYIRNSNYGVVVENGIAEIKNSVFEKNSINAITVKNSTLMLNSVTVKGGHVAALLALSGANIYADSLNISGNMTGLACKDYSFIKIKDGKIIDNKYGIAVEKNSSADIVSVDIYKNRTGVVSVIPISKKLMEMVYDNELNFKTVTVKEMKSILKPPVEVKSVALPKVEKGISVSESFKPGFTALKAPRELTASFIGNVSLGMNYFSPTSRPHPKDSVYDTTYDDVVTDSVISISSHDTTYKQSTYLGEHGDRWYDGFQPNINFFAQGKKGKFNVTTNGDIIGNTWIDNATHLYANSFVFAMNYDDQRIVLGDFYENISETSIFGRKLRGVKYTGSYMGMGRGTKRFNFELAFGQSEEKQDVGEHDYDVFGEVIDSGYATRQQMTYVTSLDVKLIRNLTLTARGIIAHDQDENPLFSTSVSDSSAPDPVSSATGCLGANLTLVDGKLDIYAELDMGAHDTVDTADAEKIAWYNPQAISALKRVFGVIRPDSNNYAFLMRVTGSLRDFDLTLSGEKIAQSYFSAGNPYLESDRMLGTFTATKRFSDELNAKLKYEYEQTSVSNVFSLENQESSPTDDHTGDLSIGYVFGENLPELSLDYEFLYQKRRDIEDQTVYVNDTTTATVTSGYDYKEVDNSGGIEVKQRFENGIDYSLRYNIRNRNELSEHPDVTQNNLDDSWEHGIKARFGFKIKRIFRNKSSFKIRLKNSVRDSSNEINWTISDNFRLTFIPRKLKLNMKGELSRKTVSEINSDTYIREDFFTWSRKLEGDLKFIINSKFSTTLSGKIENYYDETAGSSDNYSVKIGGLELTYLF